MGDSPRRIAIDGTVLGVRPDEPEADVYRYGTNAWWHNGPDPIPVFVLAQEDCWVEIVPERGEVGFVVAERELSRR